MILYVKKQPKYSPKKLLELKTNKVAERKVKKEIPFKISRKKLNI